VRAYYNEHDPYCAQWLRKLISAGHIPDGDVDERSITEVNPDEIKEYDQWHFFAGLGGWGYAARLAGIGEISGVLTGSPPCQPFSSAGKRQGYADERHLAPVWLELVAALRPAWVFGEQVAAAIKKDDWLDDLLNALETEGYATGASVLPACGVGAPHIRQRLWVVARLGDSEQPGLEGHRWDGDRGKGWPQPSGSVAETGESGGMADAKNGNGRAGQYDDEAERQQGDSQPSGYDRDSGLADSTITGRETFSSDRIRNARAASATSAVAYDSSHGWGGEAKTGWDDPDWLYCRDGKWRPVESGTFPLADGIPARVGRLRAYGNAIVPQVAAKVITETMRS